MIDFDQEFMVPVNMSVYYMDLDKANAEGYPSWELLYDYISEYGLADMSPKSMKGLSDRILTDMDTAAQFDWNKHVQRGEKPTTADQVELYCSTSTSEMHEMHECIESGG